MIEISANEVAPALEIHKSEYINKKDNLKKLNYQNSWNDVNQKLNKIIDEN